jgi:multidrug resistance efflux pump
LIVLDAAEQTYAVTAAREALKSAEADESIQGQGRRKWDGTKFVWLSGPPEQRQLAHAHTLQAQAQLAVAQAELAQATISAPMDGTVVSIRVEQGELVQSGQVVLVIANLNHLRVETTDLSERDIAHVQLHQHAKVQLKAFPDPLDGQVTAVMPLAGRSADGDTVYKVTIDLDAQPADLLWGMTGDVEIDTGS